jgi:hypothetical protein
LQYVTNLHERALETVVFIELDGWCIADDLHADRGEALGVGALDHRTQQFVPDPLTPHGRIDDDLEHAHVAEQQHVGHAEQALAVLCRARCGLGQPAHPSLAGHGHGEVFAE